MRCCPLRLASSTDLTEENGSGVQHGDEKSNFVERIKSSAPKQGVLQLPAYGGSGCGLRPPGTGEVSMTILRLGGGQARLRRAPRRHSAPAAPRPAEARSLTARPGRSSYCRKQPSKRQSPPPRPPGAKGST